MLSKSLKLIFSVFSLIWLIIIFSEYWRYNPNYSNAIELFQYYDLLIIFLGIGGLITWFIKKPRAKPIKYLNGLTIFCTVLCLDAIAVNRFTAKESGLEFSINGLFSHWGHIIGVTLCLLFIYLITRVIGGLFTTIFPSKINRKDLPVIQIAIGIMLFTFILFLLGTVGLLSPIIIVPLAILLLAFYWRYTYQYLKDITTNTFDIPKELNTIGVFSFLFLTIFITLNFAQILRPFPIGSDSLRLYVNLPALIAEYGSLVDGHQPYNWSIFMSLGMLLFGRIDVVLGLSFMGGILTLITLFKLSRKWLNTNYSALVLLVFYSLPMVSFLSYMDMKIDMGLMFFTLATLLLYYNWVKPSSHTTSSLKGIGLTKVKSFFKNRIPSVLKQHRLLVLIGLLSGFAFGIKLTVLFFVLALISTIWFFKGNILTFLISFCLCFAAIFFLRLDDQPALRQFHDNVFVLQWILLLVGLGLSTYLFVKQKRKMLDLLTYSIIIGIFFALPVLPWLTKNFSETSTISVSALLNGKDASPPFKLKNIKKGPNESKVVIPGLYSMPESPEPSKAKKSKKKSKKEGKRKDKTENAVSEDLHRFIGYEVIQARYLSLPYDVFIKSNITNFFIDVGFLLLLLFPILFLFPRVRKFEWKTQLANFTFVGLSILLLIIAIPSAFLNQNKLTYSTDGLALLEAESSNSILSNVSNFTNTVLLHIYSPVNEWFLSLSDRSTITYPLLLILFLGILSVVFIRIQRHSKVTQSIIIFVVMYFFLWWILGSGASWYGMLLFCLPFIFLYQTISSQKDKIDSSIREKNFIGSAKKVAILSFSMVWVFMAFTHRSANYNPANKETATRIYYPGVMKYTMNEYSEKKLMDNNFPNVRRLVQIINKDKKSLVYMIGSPYKYFINKNDSRVLSDTYLDFFDRLVQHAKTKEQIIKTMKEQGFKYIIFDLNMANYDVTPGKTLTKKFTQLLNTLYANPMVELVATDRSIKLNSTGQEIFEVFPDKGSIVRSGDIAIFKIK